MQYFKAFDARDNYETREREGADLRELQQILEKRAVNVILRGTKIQQDSQGNKKSWALDMMPREQWDDFCSAQLNVTKELESIIKENQEKQFYWGPKYKNNVLLYAKERIQYSNRKQMMQQNRINQGRTFRPTSGRSRIGGKTAGGGGDTNGRKNGKNDRNRTFTSTGNQSKQKLTRRQKKVPIQMLIRYCPFEYVYDNVFVISFGVEC